MFLIDSADDRSKIVSSSRMMRSKRVFSPWEVYHISEPLDFASRVQEAMQASLASELCQIDTDTPFSSPLTTPEITPPSSPTLQPASLSAPTPSLALHDLPYASDLERIKARRKASRANSRKRKRREAPSPFGEYHIREKIQQRHVKKDTRRQMPIQMQDIKVPKGGFVGKRDRDPEASGRVYSLQELKAKGFTLVEWDGIKTVCLVGQDSRVVGILAGTPGTDDWPEVAQAAADALEARRGRCSTRQSKESQYRRGNFTSLACGISYGGGQTHPMNVKNTPEDAQVVSELNDLSCFKRISGFSSSIMASRAPDLYQHYAAKIRPIYQKDPSLKRPFPNSIFCATTYNFGPETVCLPHLDKANLAYGKCSITGLGNYDYKRGGHLVLWELKLVVEFPPGATVLIPSAVITHSNTPISPGETRYSFTQYTAGTLFRWVENGFMTASSYHSVLTEEEQEQEKEKDKARWKAGISLLPVLV